MALLRFAAFLEGERCVTFSFWNFIQRVHQHHILVEIIAMLEKGLIAAEALKKC